VDETSTFQTLAEAIDKLRELVAALAGQTSRRARGDVPRTADALRRGYAEAAGVRRALAVSRSVQGIAPAALLGLVVGLCLVRRR
jgi:hypothetical protein